MNVQQKIHLFVAIVALINFILFITTIISAITFLIVLGVCLIYTWKYKKK